MQSKKINFSALSIPELRSPPICKINTTVLKYGHYSTENPCVSAPFHSTSGKCPYLAIDVLSCSFSKCFCCPRRVLQQCLRAFVHEIILVNLFYHLSDVQVRPLFLPESWHANVNCCLRTRPDDWQWYGGSLDDDDDEDRWWWWWWWRWMMMMMMMMMKKIDNDDCNSNYYQHYCRHCPLRLRRRSLNTWRSQNTCKTNFRPSSLRSTTSSWTKRWQKSREMMMMVMMMLRWPTWISCTVNSRQRERTNIQRSRRWRSKIYLQTLVKDIFANIDQRCICKHWSKKYFQTLNKYISCGSILAF